MSDQSIKNRNLCNQCFQKNKYAICVTIIFFVTMSYITFFHHEYWFEYDGIYYLHQGEQILSGNGKDTRLIGAAAGGPLTYAFVNSFVKDGFLTLKLFALFGGTGIVFLTYFITKNIFDTRIALVAQLLVAVCSRFILSSTWAINEQLPLFITVFSFYFITKKQPVLKDIVIVGALLGISFMIRYQAMFVLFAFVVFLLIRNKNLRENLMHCGVIIGLFFIFASPLLIYNYSTYGKLIDSDPNYYILGSKFQYKEWRDTLLLASAKEQNISAIFLDFNLFLKNYFYNLFYHNPNSLFNFNTWVNLSVIPIIPFLGFIPVVIGLIHVLKLKTTKNTAIMTAGSFAVACIIIGLFGDFRVHFFASIIIPLLVLGITHIRNIQQNFLPLLVLSVVFFITISIIPVNRADQLFPMWFVIPILSGIFFVETIPKIVGRSRKIHKIESKYYFKMVVVFVIIILSINIIFSYRAVLAYFYNELPSDFNKEIMIIFQNREKQQQYGSTLKEIGDLLSKQPNIENSYIMSDSVGYSYYAGSKFLFSSFQEGKKGDSIEKFITRENWSDYDRYFSNLNSHPPDRRDIYKPIPDYLIFHELVKTYSDSPWDSQIKQYEDLKILADPTNPKIPDNFKLLYKDSKTGTVVYKIYKKINDS